MRVLNPANFVDQMRLMTGDFIEGEEYLSDALYVWFYTEAGNSVLDGAIQALESIINNIALSPDRWQIGDSSEWKPAVTALTDRLTALKQKKKGLKAPVIMKSDRTNWNDFNKAFN